MPIILSPNFISLHCCKENFQNSEFYPVHYASSVKSSIQMGGRKGNNIVQYV